MQSTLIFAMVLFSCALALPQGGHQQPRIHGGHSAYANQFPHQVSLTIPSGHGSTICGGSLISKLWVLTAAQCVSTGNQVHLRFGSINRAAGGVSMASTRIVSHPNFNPITLNNNIAVIRLPTAVTLSNAIQVIRLPRRAQAGTTFVGLQATVSGWGSTEPSGPIAVPILRWVNTRVISNAQCLQSYSSATIVGHVMCTVGAVSPSQGVCDGDIGGPLVISEAGVNTQIGVVSFAAPPSLGGCSSNHPSGYTRTSDFLEWISWYTSVPVRV